MKPSINCAKCGSPVDPNDAFCGKCGEKIDWGKKNAASVSGGKQDRPAETCPLCGHRNSAGARTCESCGAAIERSDSARARNERPAKEKPLPAPGSAVKFFQSWKFPTLLGIIAVVTVVVMQSGKKSDKQDQMPPGHEELVRQIQALEKQVEGNPRDTDALLKLANAYFDQKIFPRASVAYTHYLELQPSDANARVDMGTSFFEMGLRDSLRRDEYFATAKKEMEKALTYDPKHQLAFYNLGMVNLHTGDMDAANGWFRKCWLADSTSPPGQRAFQLLNQHITNKPSS